MDFHEKPKGVLYKNTQGLTQKAIDFCERTYRNFFKHPLMDFHKNL